MATTITQTEATENFSALVLELQDCSPSQKATDFLNRIVGQIEARGTEWLTANASALGIVTHPSASHGIAPVADNRSYFIGKMQATLLGI